MNQAGTQAHSPATEVYALLKPLQVGLGTQQMGCTEALAHDSAPVQLGADCTGVHRAACVGRFSHRRVYFDQVGHADTRPHQSSAAGVHCHWKYSAPLWSNHRFCHSSLAEVQQADTRDRHTTPRAFNTDVELVALLVMSPR